MPARVSSQPIRYERQPPERTCSKSMVRIVRAIGGKRQVFVHVLSSPVRRVRAPLRRAQTRGGTSTPAQRTIARLETAPPLAALQSGPLPARVGNVLVGTASWTERTLLDSGAFYPPGVTTPADRLRYYTRHFPVVEVDATFY